MQAPIEFLTQHPALALGVVLAAVLLEAVGVDGDHEEPLSVQWTSTVNGITSGAWTVAAYLLLH